MLSHRFNHFVIIMLQIVWFQTLKLYILKSFQSDCCKMSEALTSQYWAGDTFGILKHVNKKTYFIYFHKTPQAMLVYSLYLHSKNRIVFIQDRSAYINHSKSCIVSQHIFPRKKYLRQADTKWTLLESNCTKPEKWEVMY
jgi:hypothetical protein